MSDDKKRSSLRILQTDYLQNMYKTRSESTSDIAAGVHKITDSKH
ncbi:hypothetical protein [Nostoc sphaeroides]|nr:hypothetical protein [Nostoc sphaeroides]